AVGSGRSGSDILAASYEGVTLIRRDDSGRWTARRIGEGNQDNPKGSRGASEVKLGRLKDRTFIATIEPWHGNQAVIYTGDRNDRDPTHRSVLTDRLKWGHAVWCADLNGDGDEEIV